MKRLYYIFILITIFGCGKKKLPPDPVEVGFGMFSRSWEFYNLEWIDEKKRKDSIYAYIAKLGDSREPGISQFSKLYLAYQNDVANRDSINQLALSYMKDFPNSHLPYLLASRIVYDTTTAWDKRWLNAGVYVDSALKKREGPYLCALSAFMNNQRDTTMLQKRTIALLDRAIELNPNLYCALADKASVLQGLDSVKGDRDKIRMDLIKQCIRVDSNRAWGYREMYDLSYELRAQRFYLRMASKSGLQVDTLMGFTNYQKAFYRQAADAYRNSYRSDSSVVLDDANTTRNFVLSLYIDGKREEADKIVANYCSVVLYKPYCYSMKARLLAYDHRYAEAIAQLDKAIAESPLEFIHEHHLHRIHYLILAGKRDMARNYYMRNQLALDTVYVDLERVFKPESW